MNINLISYVPKTKSEELNVDEHLFFFGLKEKKGISLCYIIILIKKNIDEYFFL